MNIKQIKTVLLLVFLVFIAFSFLIVPKERYRKGLIVPATVDYVFYTVNSYNVTVKAPKANYDIKDMTPENIRNFKKPPFEFQKVQRQRAYKKIRFDLIACNIAIVGSILAAIYTVCYYKYNK